MQKPKLVVLDDYDGSIAQLDCWKTLRNEFTVEFYSEEINPKEIADAQVIVTVRERTKITADFLNAARGLQHLALTGRLSGQADLAALKQKKISVSYTDGSRSSPAELTIAMILGITKGLHRHDTEMREGGWQKGPATLLSGKTLGILGLGRIGSKVAQFGRLMDMNVVSWGPTPDQGRSTKLGVTRLELPNVLSQSDVLVICLKLSEKTTKLLGPSELALLKDGAYLVNTARAEIIEEAALYAELSSARISAALDVFHREPLATTDALRKLPNVLLSPHMGYVTHQVYQDFFSQVAENVLNWKQGRSFRDALSP